MSLFDMVMEPVKPKGDLDRKPTTDVGTEINRLEAKKASEGLSEQEEARLAELKAQQAQG